jgi:hypothetical protein
LDPRPLPRRRSPTIPLQHRDLFVVSSSLGELPASVFVAQHIAPASALDELLAGRSKLRTRCEGCWSSGRPEFYKWASSLERLCRRLHLAGRSAWDRGGMGLAALAAAEETLMRQPTRSSATEREREEAVPRGEYDGDASPRPAERPDDDESDEQVVFIIEHV